MYRRVKSQGEGSDRSVDGSDRAVSPIVGVILLFGMVAIAATVLAISGMALVDSLQSDAAEDQGLNELSQLDHTLKTQGFDNDDVRSFILSGELGDYEMRPDGNLSITAKGQYGAKATVVNTSLQTIELETDNGRTVAYQGGGIFMGDADGSSVRSDPALQYQNQTSNGQPTNRLSFSVVDLHGNVSTGENVVNGQSSDHSRDKLDGIRYVTDVEIRIENSTYHHGWNTFLTDEFGPGAVTHIEANQTVIVDAAVDYDRPFTRYVDIYPKIYGGVHAEASGDVYLQQTALTVDGYDSRQGSYRPANATPDLITFDTHDEVRLQPQADIEGIPVSNGDLRVQSGASTSPFAFYNRSVTPSVSDPGIANGVRTAKLNDSNSFESIDPITKKIENQSIDILDDEGQNLQSVTDLSSGMYFSDTTATISGETINTSSGEAVHIGVDDDLMLEDTDIDGSGPVHIYATGDIEISNVNSSTGRPSNLWVYGTENADVTVSGDVRGVIYAPGSDSLTLEDGTELYGSAVGGDPTFGTDVTVHFDRALRSALPLTEADLDQEWSWTRPADVDVSFVLDSTGSMEDTDPEDLIKPATQNAIGMLDSSYHRAGVFEFDTEGDHLHRISSDLVAVNASVVANEEGGTNISTGIKYALDDHERVGEAGREKHMILMTDGKNEPNPWCGSYCRERADEATLAQAERADENGITIWSIGFSENADSELMEAVADQTGGEHETVMEATQIEGVMQEFLSEAIDDEEEVSLEVNLDFEKNPQRNHEAFEVQTFRFDIGSD